MRLAFRLLGLVILGLVLWFGVDLGALGRRLGAADLRLVGAALALLGPMIFAKTLRWQGLTRVGGKGYAPARAFVVFLVGLYAGSVTPGRLGELLRASYLVRDGAATPGVALASVVGDRLFDLYALLVVAAGGVAWFGLAGRLSLAGLAALVTAALSPAALASPPLPRPRPPPRRAAASRASSTRLWAAPTRAPSRVSSPRRCAPRSLSLPSPARSRSRHWATAFSSCSAGGCSAPWAFRSASWTSPSR
jgi:hypothetical protein